MVAVARGGKEGGPSRKNPKRGCVRRRTRSLRRAHAHQSPRRWKFGVTVQSQPQVCKGWRLRESNITTPTLIGKVFTRGKAKHASKMLSWHRVCCAG